MDITDIRIGHGYDVHQLAEGLPLVLGGVSLDYHLGCVAHSDGDVIIHALCDAMLGALSLRDIGYHFPDNSLEFKNIDSKILLSRVNCLIAEQGYTLGNADISIVLQKPKLSEKIPTMCEVLAKVLNVPSDKISIKATTAEKLGFVGKEEGVEAFANVILYKF